MAFVFAEDYPQRTETAFTQTTVQSEKTEFDHRQTRNLSNKLAPYGNDDTQDVQVKLIGSRYIAVANDKSKNYFGKGVPNNNYAPRIHTLKPISEKPNRIDPRALSNKSGEGYYSAQQSADGRSIGHDSEPTTLGYRRPDSKDQYTALPPIPPSKQNRNKMRDSTVFENEHWNQGGQSKLETHTEYNENYLNDGNPSNGYPPNDYGDSQQPQNNGYGQSRRQNTADKKEEIMRLLPRMVYLPTDAMKLSDQDEQKLLEVTAKEMGSCDPRSLQELYLKIAAAYDKQLTGWCLFSDLQTGQEKHQIHLSTDTMRIIASQFVRPHQPGRVNYEKYLSFLGTAQKQARNGTRSPGSPFQDREIAKLLRMVEETLKSTNYRINVEKLIAAFSMADRDLRGTLSSSQIMDVITDRTIRMPLTDSVMNQVLRTYCQDVNRDGQFDWMKFVEFLERVQPSNTSLQIPASKRPLDYAKILPPPVQSWPKAEISPRNDRVGDGPLWKKDQAYNRQDSPNRSPRLYNSEDTYRDPNRRGESPGQRRDESPGRYGRDDSPGRYGDETRRRDAPQSYRGTGREVAIAKMEDQLQDLEKSYEMMRDGIESEDKQLPWFKRFMKLASELYNREPASKKGYLPFQDVIEIGKKYNEYYSLDIPPEILRRAAHDHMDKGRVFLNPFLNSLQNMMTPKS